MRTYLIVGGLLAGLQMLAQSNVGACRDLRLANGKIQTMDARNSVVTSVTIQNGRFADSAAKLSPCARTINLRGRTAIPGLVDNHNHIVLLGIRPGHDTRLETARSIAEVQELIGSRVR